MRCIPSSSSTSIPIFKQVAALEAPEPPKAKITARGRSEKQKSIERVRKRYDKEIERIEKMTASPETKTALRKAAKNEYEEALEKIVNTS